MSLLVRYALVLSCASAAAGCGGSSASPGMPSAQAGVARVRFFEAAPQLQTLVGSIVVSFGANVYLQVDSQTIASSFGYGSITPFVNVNPGAHSLLVRSGNYALGPLKTTALAAGKRYTLVLVGTYPKYLVLPFEEPASSDDAQLSLYEASPGVPRADFGRFSPSHGDFTRLGNARLGTVATVSVGKSVAGFGGYVATASKTIGEITPSQLDPFDARDALPFHRISRLSLFLCDPQSSGSQPIGPVFGSLDE